MVPCIRRCFGSETTVHLLLFCCHATDSYSPVVRPKDDERPSLRSFITNTLTSSEMIGRIKCAVPSGEDIMTLICLCWFAIDYNALKSAGNTVGCTTEIYVSPKADEGG